MRLLRFPDSSNILPRWKGLSLPPRCSLLKDDRKLLHWMDYWPLVLQKRHQIVLPLFCSGTSGDERNVSVPFPLKFDCRALKGSAQEKEG